MGFRRAVKWSIGGVTGAGGGYFLAESIETKPVVVDSRENSDLIPGTIGQSPLKIGFIGDSLSKDFHVDTIPKTLWDLRTANQNDMFIDTNPDSLESIYEVFAKRQYVVAHEYSRPMAASVLREPRPFATKFIAKLRDFSEQVDEVVSETEFPDLLLIWIGHNNVDWVSEPEFAKLSPNEVFSEIRARFIPAYRIQLERLVDRARSKRTPSVIVALGLINFESFFKARASVERRQMTDIEKFPYPQLANTLKVFPSMGLKYRRGMIELATMLNEDLHHLVDDLKTTIPPYGPLSLEYSDALATVDISNPDFLNLVDGWHPSRMGHGVLAKAVVNGIEPFLAPLKSGFSPADHREPAAK